MTHVAPRTEKTLAPLPGQPSERVGRGAYMALTAALLGWMFDGFEMGVFSQVGRPAIQDLLNTTDEAVVGLWFNVVIACFLVGAATGGVVFGWLGDRIGRVRAMTLSVLTYALFTGLCGLATNATQVGVLRFIAALGMGGEWSLGVALVMEVWPNRSRAFMAGLIGAAANVGFLLVGVVGRGLNAVIADLGNLLASQGFSPETVRLITSDGQGWRLMMLIGTLPALLTFLIRMFVPESEKWQHEKKHGRTSHWAAHDLLAVLIGCAGPFLIVYVWAADETNGFAHTVAVRIAATLVGLAVATIGYTYPVIRYLHRLAVAGQEQQTWGPTLRRMLLAAGLSGVALLGTWGSLQQAPSYADRLVNDEIGAAAASLMASVVPDVRRDEVQAILAQELANASARKTLIDAIESDGQGTAAIAGGLQEIVGQDSKLGGEDLAQVARGFESAAHREAVMSRLQVRRNAKENTGISLAFGAIVGTIIAAFSGDWFGRRKAYFLLCVLSLASSWLFYIFNTEYGAVFLLSAFLAGACTASFYGWLPLYLPELFRTNVRATGQGFGYNFGRVLAAIGALQTGTLMGLYTEPLHIAGVTIGAGHPAACATISLIYVAGMVLIWFAPETKGQPLPE